MEYGDGRMVCFTRSFGCSLVAFFGLVFSFPVFSQALVNNPINYSLASQALSFCESKRSEGIAAMSSNSSYTGVFSNISCSKTTNPAYLSAGSSGAFILGLQLTSVSGGQTYYTAVNNYSLFESPVVSSYTFNLDDIPPSYCIDNVQFDTTTLAASTPNGTGISCYAGCFYSVSFRFSGNYPVGDLIYTWTPELTACSAQDELDFPSYDLDPADPDTLPEDVSQDADGDGILDKDDYCPNDSLNQCNIPDDTKDTDGDGVPDYKDVYPSDPTNGKGDGNGSGDGNSSGGGADCAFPPTCSGDPIQCNILFQTWSSRCNSSDVGDGDGDDNSDIIAAIDNSTSQNNSRLDGLNSLLGNVFGTSPVDNSGVIPGVSVSDVTIDSSSLNDSGFGLSRSCPSVLSNSLTFSFLGSTQSIDFSPYCDLLDLVGLLLVVLSSYVGIRILLGGR